MDIYTCKDLIEKLDPDRLSKLMKKLFDNTSKWSMFSRIPEQEHDEWGWDCLIYLEDPVRTPKSAYPYSVHAMLYKFTKNWQLMNISETYCGLNGI